MILHSIPIDRNDCFFQGYSELPVPCDKTICVHFIKEIPSYYFKEKVRREQSCAWESLKNEQSVDNIGCLTGRRTNLF